MEYNIGHIKRNRFSGEIAVRTIFPVAGTPPQPENMEWLCASAQTGTRNASTEEIEREGWDDLYVPDPTAPPPSLVPESQSLPPTQ